MNRLLPWCLIAIIAGCSGTMSVLDKKRFGGGTALIYSTDPGRAWLTAETVLRKSGAGALEENRDKGRILTTFAGGTSSGTFTTSLGVFVEAAQGGTKVTCATSSVPPGFHMTEGAFHALFSKALGLRGVQPPPETGVAPCGKDDDCERGICFEHGCR
jgi:hypothetical protein